jgi:hypothetical protein
MNEVTNGHAVPNGLTAAESLLLAKIEQHLATLSDQQQLTWPCGADGTARNILRQARRNQLNKPKPRCCAIAGTRRLRRPT